MDINGKFRCELTVYKLMLILTQKHLSFFMKPYNILVYYVYQPIYMFKNLWNNVYAYSDNLLFNDVDINMYNVYNYFLSKYLNLKVVLIL